MSRRTKSRADIPSQWLASNASTGWSVGIDSIAVNGKKISLDGYYATLDPAADEIAMPGDLIDTIAMRIGVSRTTGSTRFVSLLVRPELTTSTSTATRPSP